jgi:hypothetical protein
MGLIRNATRSLTTEITEVHGENLYYKGPEGCTKGKHAAM